MTPQIKQRIEQIRRGEVPDGYKRTKVGLVPEEWDTPKAKEIFSSVSDKKYNENLEVLSATQDRGVIPRSQVDIDIKYDKSSVLGYKKVSKGNYVISLRSFQGGIEYSEYDGLVSPAYIVLKEKREICQLFFKTYFKTDDYIKRLAVATYGIRDGKSISFEDFGTLRIPFPPLFEQEKIAEILQTQDKLIELQQKKIEELKKLKKAYLSKMFPKKGCNVPEIRFPGFTDPWEQRKLGDMMNVTSVKRIHQSDWTDSGVRFLRARDIVAAAKNEEPDDYLYISKEKYEEYSALSGKVGVSDLLVTGVGTIGVPYLVRNLEPLYFKDGNIIWFQNSDKIDGKFLFYSFSAEQIQGFINESAGIGTVGTYTIESGKKTPISLPNQIEQAKVGDFFQQLDNLITLHQRKLEEMKIYKKSLMQLLLTGIVRM